MRPSLLVLLLLAPGAAAFGASVDVPDGPAYSVFEGQLARRDGKDFRPRGQDWSAHGLSFHDMISNLDPDMPSMLVIIVRRPSDKLRAARSAREALGKAAWMVRKDLLNVLTIEEYLGLVVHDLDADNKRIREPLAVDFGALRARIAADLKGARGAVYIIRHERP